MIRVIYTDISRLSQPDYQRLYEKATRERRLRAHRCRRREDALRCVVADALLRYALGHGGYTVDKTPSGKPFLRDREGFHYNLSHGGNWVALAFGDSEVGVDVEETARITDTDAISRRFFSAEEQRYLREARSRSRDRFFEIWTGKESYVKYLGTGLGKDLTSFSVLSPEPGIRFHHRKPDADHCLCLCTTDDHCAFTQLDPQELL